jgi:hypothetical protein
MKKLVLTAALLGGLAQLATGCLIVDDTDPPPPPPPPLDVGTITAEWNLVAGDNNDFAVDCDGGTTMTIVSVPSIGDPYFDSFECIPSGIATTAELPVDLYSVYLEVTDETGELLYAASLAQLDVAVDAGFDTQLSFEFSVNRGAFDVGWDVLDGGVAISCEDALATEFALDSTYVDTGDLFVDTFPCTDYAGTTAVLPIGPWVVKPSIIDDTQLAVGEGLDMDASIDYGNHYYDLGIMAVDLQAP